MVVQLVVGHEGYGGMEQSLIDLVLVCFFVFAVDKRAVWL